jgi:phospholipid N-methyltransferase
MENNHQVAWNSARQIRTVEHYKFENVCQLPSLKSTHFDAYSLQKGIYFHGDGALAGSRDWTIPGWQWTIRASMSALFFKRFLQRPFQIASIVPSSRALVERVGEKIDFNRARVIAEYGPGEGVHSREIARQMRPDAQLLLFELDPAFSRDLRRQFADDPRVHVLNDDAANLPQEMKKRGIGHCDYILSGIPFSILKIDKKRALLKKTYDALAPGGAFIIYQVTNELKQHATFFDEAESEYFLQNIPPMFITVFRKGQTINGYVHPVPLSRSHLEQFSSRNSA